MPVIPVRIDDETKARWVGAAKREDQSLAAFVRDAVDDRINGPAPAPAQAERGKALKGARARTELCPHRRRPEQFCSRCDT